MQNIKNAVAEPQIDKKEQKEKILQVVQTRKTDFEYMAEKFTESITVYKILLELIKENDTRFKKEHFDHLLDQFNNTVISFKTQRKNSLKAVRTLNKILSKPEEHTVESILEILKI